VFRIHVWNPKHYVASNVQTTVAQQPPSVVAVLPVPIIKRDTNSIDFFEGSINADPAAVGMKLIDWYIGLFQP